MATILLEFNCVTQFDMCYTDWEKVQSNCLVCHVLSSDDILMLQKWEQISLE